jgi:hypothetical protein
MVNGRMPDPSHPAPSAGGALPAEPAADLQFCIPPAAAREAALYRRLAVLGIAWTTHAHVSVFTVEEARHLRGTLPGTHTKNLFLTEKKDGLWLISAREDLRVDSQEPLAAPASPLARPNSSWKR